MRRVASWLQDSYSSCSVRRSNGVSNGPETDGLVGAETQAMAPTRETDCGPPHHSPPEITALATGKRGLNPMSDSVDPRRDRGLQDHGHRWRWPTGHAAQLGASPWDSCGRSKPTSLRFEVFRKRALFNTPTGRPPLGTERCSITPFNNSCCSTTASRVW